MVVGLTMVKEDWGRGVDKKKYQEYGWEKVKDLEKIPKITNKITNNQGNTH